MIIDKAKEIENKINGLKEIQLYFRDKFGVKDILSNSKLYEVLIANALKHEMIPGHSGSRDGKDSAGNEFEYKHYKATSSNHSWTFNDYSDNTIEKMKSYDLIFAHINDIDYPYPGILDWYIYVKGIDMSNYLYFATQSIQNQRKMINVSQNQILNNLKVEKTFINIDNNNLFKGEFEKQLLSIQQISSELETLTDTTKILTSNKFWELLVAIKLKHHLNSEQGGRLGSHDAFDDLGNTFEYKVYQSKTWNFQDISENVLIKYLDDKKIILAVVDKENVKVNEIYSVDPQEIVFRLREKLKNKILRYEINNKPIRRLQESITSKDLKSFKSLEILFMDK